MGASHKGVVGTDPDGTLHESLSAPYHAESPAEPWGKQGRWQAVGRPQSCSPPWAQGPTLSLCPRPHLAPRSPSW